jgi:hypothetical protein
MLMSAQDARGPEEHEKIAPQEWRAHSATSFQRFAGWFAA